MLRDAIDLYPPALRIGGLVAQALERNPDLDHVAGVGDEALRIELVIRVPIALVETHEVTGAAGAVAVFRAFERGESPGRHELAQSVKPKPQDENEMRSRMWESLAEWRPRSTKPAEGCCAASITGA